MAKFPWKPWHEVVTLRDDLLSGDLPMHLFAADLYEVMMQNGNRPIYENPEEFFALTFPTHNLRAVVRDVVLRLAGKNDKAVRQLELTYGGGKTHTLITMRHLVHDPANLPDLPAVGEFIETIGQTPPKARVAALCFDKLDVETGAKSAALMAAVRRLKQPWSVLALSDRWRRWAEAAARGRQSRRTQHAARGKYADGPLVHAVERRHGHVDPDRRGSAVLQGEGPLRSGLAGHPDLVLPVPDPGGGQGGSMLYRGVVAFQ